MGSKPEISIPHFASQTSRSADVKRSIENYVFRQKKLISRYATPPDLEGVKGLMEASEICIRARLSGTRLTIS